MGSHGKILWHRRPAPYKWKTSILKKFLKGYTFVENLHRFEIFLRIYEFFGIKNDDIFDK